MCDTTPDIHIFYLIYSFQLPPPRWRVRIIVIILFSSQRTEAQKILIIF